MRNTTKPIVFTNECPIIMEPLNAENAILVCDRYENRTTTYYYCADILTFLRAVKPSRISPVSKHPGKFSYLRLSDLSDAQLASLLCPSETEEEERQTLKEHEALVACSALQQDFPWQTADYSKFSDEYDFFYTQTIASDTQPYEVKAQSMSHMTTICFVDKDVLPATIKAISSRVKMLFPAPNYTDIETLKETYSNPSNFQDSTAAHLAFIGSLWQQHGENKQAKKYYQAAIKKDPDCLVAKINLSTEETIKDLCVQVLDGDLYLHSQVEVFMLFVAAMTHCDNDTVRSLWEDEDIKNNFIIYEKHPSILQCLQSCQAMAFPKPYSRAPKKPYISLFVFTMEAALWAGHTEVVDTLLDEILPKIANKEWNGTNSVPHQLRDWMLKTAVLSGKPEVVRALISHEGFLPKNLPKEFNNALIIGAIDWLLNNSEDTAEEAAALHDMLAELYRHGEYLQQQGHEMKPGFQMRDWLLWQAIKLNKCHLVHQLLGDPDFWKKSEPTKPYPGMPQGFQIRHWPLFEVTQHGGDIDLLNQFLEDPRFWHEGEFNKSWPGGQKGLQMRHWLIGAAIRHGNIDLLNQLLENQRFWKRLESTSALPRISKGFQMRHWLIGVAIELRKIDLLDQLLKNPRFWSTKEFNQPYPRMPQGFQIRHWLIMKVIQLGNIDILNKFLKDPRFWHEGEFKNHCPGMPEGFQMRHWLIETAVQYGHIELFNQFLGDPRFWHEDEFNKPWPEQPEGIQMRHWLICVAILHRNNKLFDQFLRDPRFWHKDEFKTPWPEQPEGIQMRHWLIETAVRHGHIELFNQFLKDPRFWHEGELNKAWPEQPEGFQMRHWPLFMAVKHRNLKSFKALLQNPAIPPFERLRLPVKKALIEDISILPKDLSNQFMDLLNPGAQKRKQNSTDKSKSTAQMTDRLRRAKRAKIKTPSPKGKTAKPAKRAPGTTDHAAAKEGTTAPKRMKRSNNRLSMNLRPAK